MTPQFPDLAKNLSAAAERAVRPRRRRIIPALGVGLATVGIAGGAAAATGVWNPQIGDTVRGTQTPSAQPIPAAQLDAFAVLRRDQTNADRGPDSTYLLRLTSLGWSGIRTAGVRLLSPGTPGDKTAGARILVPVDHADGIDDALCIGVIDPTDGWGGSCYSTSSVLAGRAVVGFARSAPPTAEERAAVKKAVRSAAEKRARAGDASADRDAPSTTTRITEPIRIPQPRTIDARIYGLVPDGVAQVERTARDGSKQTAPVSNNTIEFATGADPTPGTLRWIDQDGRVTRTVPASWITGHRALTAVQGSHPARI